MTSTYIFLLVGFITFLANIHIYICVCARIIYPQLMYLGNLISSVSAIILGQYTRVLNESKILLTFLSLFTIFVGVWVDFVIFGEEHISSISALMCSLAVGSKQ